MQAAGSPWALCVRCGGRPVSGGARVKPCPSCHRLQVRDMQLLSWIYFWWCKSTEHLFQLFQDDSDSDDSEEEELKVEG